MHELGAGTADGMFQNIGAQPDETVRDETLPAGILPLRLFESIPAASSTRLRRTRDSPLPRRSPISLN